MYLITWNARYATGIEEIDQQHRHLVGLLNTIHDAFVNRSTNWANDNTLEKLTIYTKYHCSEEESLMREYDYPGYALHTIRHKQFVAHLETMREDFCNGKRKMSIELLTFLNTWLLSHILDADIDMGRFVMADINRKAV